MSHNTGQVGRVPAAASPDAQRHFEARLSYETDPSEVQEDQTAGAFARSSC